MKNYLYVPILILLTAACTTHPKVGAVTQPATVIKTKDTNRIIGKLSEICDRHGLQIDSSSSNNLICSQQSPILAQALLGTKYGTDVRSVVRFNAFPVGAAGTRVVGYMSMGNQTVFGQSKTTDMGTGGKMGTQVQFMLDQARKELEAK